MKPPPDPVHLQGRTPTTVAFRHRPPQLAEARGKGKACPIAVAKLDRLSRDVHFINGVIGRNVHPTRLSFVRGRNSDLRSFELFFGCPVSGWQNA